MGVRPLVCNHQRISVDLFREIVLITFVVGAGWIASLGLVRLLHSGAIPPLSDYVFPGRGITPLPAYIEASYNLRFTLVACLAGVVFLLRFYSWFTSGEGVGAATGVLTFGLLSFAYFPPSRALFPVHDYLDSEHVLLALRGTRPQFFALSGEMESVLGGVPLSALGISDFNLLANLYVLMESATAASIAEIVVRILGYGGAYILLRQFIVSGAKHSSHISAAFAMGFALAPYWPSLSATIALQAPFFAGLLLLRSGARSQWASASIILYPLLTDFARGGFAVATVVALLVVSDAHRHRHENLKRIRRPLLVAGLAVALSLVRPLHLVAFTDFVSHRTDWSTPDRIFGNPGALPSFLSALVELVPGGYYHFASGQNLMTFAAVGLGVILLLSDTRRCGVSTASIEQRRFVVAGAWALGITVIAASEMSGVTAFGSRLPIPVQLARFYALLPLAWTILGATAIAAIFNHASRLVRLIAATILLLVPLGATLQNHAISGKALVALGGGRASNVTIGDWQLSTIGAYYQTDSFDYLVELNETGAENVVVVSFGIDPMKAAFSGLSTLDGYHYNYRVDHKRRFRLIIEDELSRTASEELFDSWGSRAYLSFDPDPQASRIDFCAARRLGATHLLSRHELADERLTLLNESSRILTYAISTESCEPSQ